MAEHDLEDIASNGKRQKLFRKKVFCCETQGHIRVEMYNNAVQFPQEYQNDTFWIFPKILIFALIDEKKIESKHLIRSTCIYVVS